MLEGTPTGLKFPRLPTRGASVPTLRFTSGGSEGPRWPRASLRLAISSPSHPSVWFRPGRGKEAGRRGHRKFPLLLRARFVDVSWALALKGAGALPKRSYPPLEVEGLGAERMGFGLKLCAVAWNAQPRRRGPWLRSPHIVGPWRY